MNCVIFLLLLGGSMILGALTGQFLLGDYQVSFALGFGIVAFVCVICWPSRPLPSGGNLRSVAREALLYTAPDGRTLAIDYFWGKGNYHTLYMGDRWGFTDGPLVTDAERQMILADIAEEYRRKRKAYVVKADDETIIATSPDYVPAGAAL